MFMNQSERQAKGKWNSPFVRNNIFKKKTFSVNFWCFIEGVDNPDASATACLRSPTCELKGHEGKLILKFICVKTVLLLNLYMYFLPLPHRSCLRLSLRKHSFLHTPRRWGRLARRNVCDSATEIPYWWRKICPESGQKPWLVYGVVTLF